MAEESYLIKDSLEIASLDGWEKMTYYHTLKEKKAN